MDGIAGIDSSSSSEPEPPLVMSYPDGVDPWPSAMLSVAAASTPPASWYRQSEVLHVEESRVFQRGWQAVGRADQVIDIGQLP